MEQELRGYCASAEPGVFVISIEPTRTTHKRHIKPLPPRMPLRHGWTDTLMCRLTMCLAVLLSTASGAVGAGAVVEREQTDSANMTPLVRSEMTAPRRRIGVVDFKDKSGFLGDRVGSLASTMLVTELTKTDKFIVVEREQLERVLEEQRLLQADHDDEWWLSSEARSRRRSFDPSKSVEVRTGELLGLNDIIVGVVSEAGTRMETKDYLVAQSESQMAEITVDVRTINVETGQVILADSARGKARVTTRVVVGLGARAGRDHTLESKALRSAIVQLTENIISQVNRRPWSCRIAKLAGREIFLNAGPSMGLRIGQRLECFHLGESIKDPTTGLSIGHKEDLLGYARVTGSLASGDGSVADVTYSTGVLGAPNDVCRLTQRDAPAAAD